jgi:hypothetical protein
MEKLKYRLKFTGNGWQVQSRVYWFFWMNVGPLHKTYESGGLAVRMANGK